MIIYLDVLAAVNLYINFFLIKASALILKRDLPPKRAVLSSSAGALGSFIILAPELPIIVSMLYKALLCSVMVFTAFGKQKPADFGISAAVFLTVNFIFAGLMQALWTFSSPLGMFYSNGVCYFGIPLAALAAFTAAAYFSVKLFAAITCKTRRAEKILPVKISRGREEVTLRGFTDTGCAARDIFTHSPLMICEMSKISAVLPEEIKKYLSGDAPEKIRLVPCRTISGELLLPVFKPDKIIIGQRPASALVAVSMEPLGEDFDCLFDPEIISI